MLLQNFDHIMTYFAGALAGDHLGRDTKVKRTDGSTNYPGVAYYNAIALSDNRLCIGNGTQEVTYEDYRLTGSKIGKRFISVATYLDFVESKNCWTRKIIVKYSNETDEDFVVSEWGIWRAESSNTPSEYNNGSNSVTLVWRELLDEPITIAANSTATLTFTMDVPHELNRF